MKSSGRADLKGLSMRHISGFSFVAILGVLTSASPAAAITFANVSNWTTNGGTIVQNAPDGLSFSGTNLQFFTSLTVPPRTVSFDWTITASGFGTAGVSDTSTSCVLGGLCLPVLTPLFSVNYGNLRTITVLGRPVRVPAAGTASATGQFSGLLQGPVRIGAVNVIRGNYQITLSNIESAVPEPASWALLITGFGLTGAMLRRRRALAPA
jgi:hypothetical protein